MATPENQPESFFNVAAFQPLERNAPGEFLLHLSIGLSAQAGFVRMDLQTSNGPVCSKQ